MGAHRLLSRQFARLALCLQVGQRCSQTLSEGGALKVRVVARRVLWSGTLHMRFYGFEKVAALERATCLEPDGIILQLSADWMCSTRAVRGHYVDSPLGFWTLA